MELSLVNCRQKTAVNNIYRNKHEAKRRASRFRRVKQAPLVRSYRCKHCGYYHLGTANPKYKEQIVHRG